MDDKKELAFLKELLSKTGNEIEAFVIVEEINKVKLIDIENKPTPPELIALSKELVTVMIIERNTYKETIQDHLISLNDGVIEFRRNTIISYLKSKKQL